MNKLENMPKKNFFNAPEGYFESLPNVIHKRLEKPKKIWEVPVFRYSLQYALPVVVLLVTGIFWFSTGESAENLLASVETTELVNYLAELDYTSLEFTEEWDLTKEEAVALEQTIYSWQWQDENFDTIIQELDLNTL